MNTPIYHLHEYNTEGGWVFIVSSLPDANAAAISLYFNGEKGMKNTLAMDLVFGGGRGKCIAQGTFEAMEELEAKKQIERAYWGAKK